VLTSFAILYNLLIVMDIVSFGYTLSSLHITNLKKKK
jgi:hypothetical protein